MRDDQNQESRPRPTMPAPQLPNFPISPDDPFQSDPDLLPPVTTPPARDPASGGRQPGKRPGQAPTRDNLDDFEIEPDASTTFRMG